MHGFLLVLFFVSGVLLSIFAGLGFRSHNYLFLKLAGIFLMFSVYDLRRNCIVAYILLFNLKNIFTKKKFKYKIFL